MHRKSWLMLGCNTIVTKLLLLVLVCAETRFFIKNPYIVDASSSSSYLKECEQLTCKIGEQCVNRKFWCNHWPCPNMTYCSKSRKESLRGPETCESVMCTSGYKCLVQVRDCDWNQKCRQRAARCVSEQKFYEGPASCVDVECPAGYQCILRESHCFRAPCKLMKNCAPARDVDIWFDKCKELGCKSEHECFLRKPSVKCTIPPCNHVPDCLAPTNWNDHESNSNEYCHGWICPPNQECSAHVDTPCKNDNCRVTRFCHEPLLRTPNVSRDFEQHRTTLTDIEREIFLEEQKKLQNFLRSTSVSNFSQMILPARSSSEIMPTRVSPYYKNPDYATVKVKRVMAMPNVRSTSFDDSLWLTYLKRKAGAEAVQYWIEKAKNNEGYGEFVEWLEFVEDLLDPDTYRLWMREVELATANVPEFQSWISPWNLDAHRSTLSRRLPNSEPAVEPRSFFGDMDEDARRTFPGSIGEQAKNLFYGDRSRTFVESGSSSKPDYRLHGEKQTMPSIVGARPYVSRLENPSQQRRPSPSNFNFNEARRFDETPGFRADMQGAGVTPPSPSLPLSYREITHRQPDHDPALLDYGRRLPLSQAQEFVETVKNSWKSWQSYYQLSPPPLNLLGFPEQAPTRTSYYLSNYSQARENFSVNAMPNIDAQKTLHQPQMFFPNVANANKPAVNKDANQSPIESSNYSPLDLFPLSGTGLNGYNAPNNVNKSENVSASMENKSIIDQITGIKELNQLKPNIIKLDTSEHISQLLVSSNGENNEHVPNLLIYFPPPLNFLIYYSVNNPNHNTNGNITLRSENATAGNGRLTISLEQPNLNHNKNNSYTKIIDLPVTEVSQWSYSDSTNHSEILDKQKELEYIRKIIRELISEDYGRKEEMPSNSHGTSNQGAVNRNVNTITQSKNENLPIVENENPTFNAFLQWLLKNVSNPSASSSETTHPKALRNSTKSTDSSHDDQSNPVNLMNLLTHSINSSSLQPKNFRILVDIDKHPELMKALLSTKNVNSKNESDTNEYQIIVNLEDIMDPKEKDLISKRLINIATNQLHKNLTEDQKLSKILWVFPIHDAGGNETLSDIERRNHRNTNIFKDIQTETDYRTKNNTEINKYDNEHLEDDYMKTIDEDYEEHELYEDPEDQTSEEENSTQL